MGGYIRFKVPHLNLAAVVPAAQRRLARLAALAGTERGMYVWPEVPHLSLVAAAPAAQRWLPKLAALSGIERSMSACPGDAQAMSSVVPTPCENTQMEHAPCIGRSGIMDDVGLVIWHNRLMQFPRGLKMDALTAINEKAN